jgi:hypothetical protein
MLSLRANSMSVGGDWFGRGLRWEEWIGLRGDFTKNLAVRGRRPLLHLAPSQYGSPPYSSAHNSSRQLLLFRRRQPSPLAALPNTADPKIPPMSFFSVKAGSVCCKYYLVHPLLFSATATFRPGWCLWDLILNTVLHLGFLMLDS